MSAEDLGGGILCVRADNPSPFTLTGTRTYVIGRERVVILDPGPDDPDHLRAVETVVGGRPVEAVCLTHSHMDHAAAAGEASERWGPLRASRETLARIALPGRPLRDEEAIELGEGLSLTALFAPGHSGDHFCFLLAPGRDLFTGDLVLGRGSSVIVHPDGSVRDCLTSLARLLTLRPARLHPGHGPPVADAVARLEAYRVHRLERARHVLAAIEAGADSVESIRTLVYWELPSSHHAAAEMSIRAYVAFLRDSGHAVPADIL